MSTVVHSGLWEHENTGNFFFFFFNIQKNFKNFDFWILSDSF